MSKKFTQTSYKLKSPQRLVAGSTMVRSAQFNDYIDTYRVVGNSNFWLATGSSTVTAQSSAGNTTSTFHIAGVTEYINANGRYASVIAESSTAGIVSIAEAVQ